MSKVMSGTKISTVPMLYPSDGERGVMAGTSLMGITQDNLQAMDPEWQNALAKALRRARRANKFPITPSIEDE